MSDASRFSSCSSIIILAAKYRRCKRPYVGRGFSPDGLLVLFSRKASALKPRPTYFFFLSSLKFLKRANPFFIFPLP